tara:strand:- start:175 stop:735 length:561 start_codon:yes stop_codon:yes gene_type:complete
LSLEQSIGILIAVSGAALITVSRRKAVANTGSPTVYLLVFLGTIFTATALVTYKYALVNISFWNLTSIRSFSLGAVLVVGGYQHNLRNDIKRITEKSWMPVYMLFFAEAVLAPIGMITQLQSLALGPVSLASSLMSIPPFVVLIISGILSTQQLRLLNEPIDRRTLPVKLFSTILIFLGVCLITLY